MNVPTTLFKSLRSNMHEQASISCSSWPAQYHVQVGQLNIMFKLASTAMFKLASSISCSSWPAQSCSWWTAQSCSWWTAQSCSWWTAQYNGQVGQLNIMFKLTSSIMLMVDSSVNHVQAGQLNHVQACQEHCSSWPAQSCV